MSPLEQLRAFQHDELALPSDHALGAYLAGVSAEQAYLDLAPHTPVEIRHLARTRSTT